MRPGSKFNGLAVGKQNVAAPRCRGSYSSRRPLANLGDEGGEKEEEEEEERKEVQEARETVKEPGAVRLWETAGLDGG
ncbi:hypothetical protein KM043_002616 [Ampulex compressa]|nr:hypothetical protein KM043_002616 [Ampulex compressa]